jgi:hypothetical protein
VRLEVEDSGASVVIWLWVNGDFQASYTFTGSFAGNYMAFVAFAGESATQSSHYDNFTLGPIPPRTVLRFR